MNKKPSPDLSPTNSTQTPKFLSETHIDLRCMGDVDHRDFVPPNTPKGLILDYVINGLPTTFPRLTKLNLPIVRKVGVRGAMEAMSIPFKCEDFKVNLVQFWFLDIFVDCLWRLQDEYNFPMKFQNVVLEWVLYFFDLIRAPDMNLSRGKVFRVFREAIRLCEDLVESGVETFPRPEDVFVLNEETLESTRTFEDDDIGSASSIFEEDDEEDDEEYLLVRRDGIDEVYRLPEKVCAWYAQDEDCLSTSEETSTEHSSEDKSTASESPKSTNSTIGASSGESLENEQIEYYKPDMSTPPRFKSHLFLSESDTSVMSYLEEENEMEGEDSDRSNEPQIFKWMSMPRKLPHGPCPSRIFDPTEEEKKRELVEEEIKRTWQDYNLWHIKRDDIHKTGDEDHERKELTKKLKEFLKERRNEENDDETKFVNTCALLAIKEFINDYFYDSFQFTLITIAMRHPHRLLVQELNATWNVPKLFKGELKRPAVKIPKPPKKAQKKEKGDKSSKGSEDKKKKKEKGDKSSKKSKEEKKKKGKKEKGDKSSEGSEDKKKKKGKKEKGEKSSEGSEDKKKKKGKKEKGDKSSKKSKEEKKKGKKEKEDKTSKKSKKEKDDKTSKKSKKGKDDKTSKGSKKQKKEKSEEQTSKTALKKQLDKLEMEQLKRMEENKKYVFPLNDAVNDDFFQDIFEGWQRTPKKSKSDVKDKDSKKGAKDKSSKKSAKDKDSKKSAKDDSKSAKDKDSKKKAKEKAKKKKK